MRKLFILSLLVINSFNLVFAQELVLSDRIREAREAAKREEIKEKVSNIKPVNSEKREINYKGFPELKNPNQQGFCKP